MDFDEKIDCSGLKCPMPAMKAKKALTSMTVGQILLIVTTDKASCISIPSITRQIGHELLDTAHEGNEYFYRVKKLAPA